METEHALDKNLPSPRGPCYQLCLPHFSDPVGTRSLELRQSSPFLPNSCCLCEADARHFLGHLSLVTDHVLCDGRNTLARGARTRVFHRPSLGAPRVPEVPTSDGTPSLNPCLWALFIFPSMEVCRLCSVLPSATTDTLHSRVAVRNCPSGQRDLNSFHVTLISSAILHQPRGPNRFHLISSPPSPEDQTEPLSQNQLGRSMASEDEILYRQQAGRAPTRLVSYA